MINQTVTVKDGKGKAVIKRSKYEANKGEYKLYIAPIKKVIKKTISDELNEKSHQELVDMAVKKNISGNHKFTSKEKLIKLLTE